MNSFLFLPARWVGNIPRGGAIAPAGAGCIGIRIRLSGKGKVFAAGNARFQRAGPYGGRALAIMYAAGMPRSIRQHGGMPAATAMTVGFFA